MTAPILLIAFVTSGSLLLGIGMGVLSLHCIIGIGYFISGAAECYNKQVGIGAMFKSHLIHEQGSVFIGILKAICTCFCAPLLLLGGLCGMASRGLVNLIFDESKETTKPNNPEEQKQGTPANKHSYSKLVSSLGKSQPKTSNPEEPKPNPPNMHEVKSDSESVSFGLK